MHGRIIFIEGRMRPQIVHPCRRSGVAKLRPADQFNLARQIPCLFFFKHHVSDSG